AVADDDPAGDTPFHGEIAVAGDLAVDGDVVSDDGHARTTRRPPRTGRPRIAGRITRRIPERGDGPSRHDGAVLRERRWDGRVLSDAAATSWSRRSGRRYTATSTRRSASPS